MSRNRKSANDIIKNTLNTMIKYISIIAIFVSIGLILVLYLGPEINLATSLVFRLAVPSVILTISSLVIFELWIANGRRSAFEEEDYTKLLKVYDTKSDGLYYPVLQNFLDWERNRRYIVEEDRLKRLLEREEAILDKLETTNSKKWRDKWNRWQTRLAIRHYRRDLDTIKVSMPYEKSEEFDYLRYNIQDIIYKEYAPSDTKRHLVKARTKKYANTITFTLVGLNILSIGGAMGNIWVAIIMTSLALVALLMSVIKGFSVGYNNIKVISTGVYKTANSFLDQAVAYCMREKKDLYYKGVTEFREASKNEPEQDTSKLNSHPIDDIFTKAALEVTETS